MCDDIINVSASDNNKKNVKLTSTYSYNNANMLTSLVNKNGKGTTLSSYSYSYNLDGNINKKTETGKTTTYTYDGSNRLTGENITKSGKNTNMSYTYDGAGNRLSLTVSGSENYVTTYNYDAGNRLIKSSKKNSGASYSDVMYYSYDNNGNQTRIDKAREENTGKMKLGIYSANENSGYGYEFFTYDGLNQLIKYGDEKNNTASYEYLSNGLRLSKTVKGEKTSFIWDGNNIQFTISSDETVSYSRVPGYMRASSTKAMESSAPAMQRDCTLYLYNGHGDVTGTTNKDGNIKKTYDYDAFGNEISPDSSDTNPFRYCGEYYDSETESIYLRARYYNMSTGRFISEDPIKDGLNWYAYCGGNPVMFVDPWGLAEYSINGKIPNISDTFDEGFKYDPSAVPSEEDYESWKEWNRNATLAGFVPWLKDASKMYKNYLSNSGEDQIIDYERAYKEDGVIKKYIDNEISIMKNTVNSLYFNGDAGTSFKLVGTLQGIPNGDSENWQKTIGAHYVYGVGYVTIDPETEKATMQVTFYTEDMYNFNPGQADIASGTPDAVNGRFAELGWAKEFKTTGSITFTETWQMSKSPTLSGGANGGTR